MSAKQNASSKRKSSGFCQHFSYNNIFMTELKILLTTGEKIIADKLSKLFVKAQYAVEVAFDGNMGKKLFDEHSYDLILIDFNLPDISGCDVCHYIRHKDEHIPLFMFSTGTTDHKYEAFHADVNEYLMVAGDFRELLIRIKTLTKRFFLPISHANRIVSGDITLDLDSKEVVRGERAIFLSAREFLLLQYLLRNRNKVVSRHDIASKLWNRPCDSHEDRVAAFMHSLRMKVDRNISHKVIYTVRGKGYMVTD
jgi:two-component system copper resistance phosphate regulon response regulator CusR